jgi:cell division protein FtsB
MAVYEGARPRPGVALPRRPSGGAGLVPRRRLKGAVRARRRPRRLGLLLGGIVVAFLLAFFSLAQTVRVAATGYEAERFATELEQLDARARDVRSDLNRLGREPAIRKQAADLGLVPLGDPIVLPAR